jgi:MoaA/NifB/PqqE/SkfB family radical SAM enzyme
MSYISPQKIFAHIDRLAAWRSGHTPAPVTVEFDLTNTCSLGCQFCHFRHTHVAGPWAAQETAKPKDYSDTGRIADLAFVLPALTEMRLAGVLGVIWTGGGEPTLHPAFDQVIVHAHDAGLEQGMYTLGGHISEARARIIKDRFKFVVVSLDCADAETYATEKHVPKDRFDRACEGIRRLGGGSCVVGASFLLHAGNWSRAFDMLALARSLGATYTTFRPTIDVSMDRPSVPSPDRGWVTDALPTLIELAAEANVEIDPARFEEYRDWTDHGYATCYGIRLVTQVTPDGRVWVCPNRRGMPGSEVGDLTKESFAAIWARHPGQWTDLRECRVMCRLHLVNQQLDTVEAPIAHASFV